MTISPKSPCKHSFPIKPSTLPPFSAQMPPHSMSKQTQFNSHDFLNPPHSSHNKSYLSRSRERQPESRYRTPPLNPLSRYAIIIPSTPIPIPHHFPQSLLSPLSPSHSSSPNSSPTPLSQFNLPPPIPSQTPHSQFNLPPPIPSQTPHSQFHNTERSLYSQPTPPPSPPQLSSYPSSIHPTHALHSQPSLSPTNP